MRCLVEGSRVVEYDVNIFLGVFEENEVDTIFI